MQTYKDYTKSWMETPLTTESEIKDFYWLNRESIMGVFSQIPEMGELAKFINSVKKFTFWQSWKLRFFRLKITTKSDLKYVNKLVYVLKQIFLKETQNLYL